MIESSLNKKKERLAQCVRSINALYGQEVITLEMTDQYYNMREVIESYMHIVERAVLAMQLSEVTPIIRPIRGGTDGARLSQMGLPCPNIFAGGMNFHGRYEYASLDVMCRAVLVLLGLCSLEHD